MDEETPLLAAQSQNYQQNNPGTQKTPLPWRQLSILLLLSVSEPITSQVIAPFLPQVRFQHCTSITRTRVSSRVADKGDRYHRWKRLPYWVLCWTHGSWSVRASF